jgi:hypothetical protein
MSVLQQILENNDLCQYLCRFLNDPFSIASFSKVCKAAKHALSVFLQRTLPAACTVEEVSITNELSNYLKIHQRYEQRIRNSSKKGLATPDFPTNKVFYGKYLGSGGFARVFELGKTTDLCIKFGQRGRSVEGKLYTHCD